MPNAGAHKAFGTPRPYSTNTEDDDAERGELVHCIVAHKQLAAL